MKKLTIETLRESNLIAYEYIRGSTLYGLNTPTSDIDVGGVYIAPIENILGLPKHYQEQVSDERSDVTFYEVSKWLDLLIKSNPNALESLFIPKDKVIGEIHPAIQLIIDNRDMFVTKECFKPFLGYAIEQIKKARGLNKKIVNPVTERKTILDFCYTTYNQGSSNIQNWLAYRGLKQEYCGLVAISNMRDFYGVYYDWGMHLQNENITFEDLDETFYSDATESNLYKLACSLLYFHNVESFFDNCFNSLKPIGYKGIAKVISEETNESNEVRLSSVEKGVMPICHMAYNKDGYVTHCKDYREYKEWEKNRNPVRYESNLNKNYDSKNLCHTVRLMHMGIEIARGQGFNVVRDWDRDFLMKIRNHEYEYDYLINYVDQKKIEIEEAIAKSTLPETVDETFVQDLLIQVRKLSM